MNLRFNQWRARARQKEREGPRESETERENKQNICLHIPRKCDSVKSKSGPDFQDVEFPCDMNYKEINLENSVCHTLIVKLT